MSLQIVGFFRALFSKTMQQRHLFHASSRKLQDDMKDNMRRYKSEKAKLQEQLASLRSQLDDYHLDTCRSHGPSDKAADQPDMVSHPKPSHYYTKLALTRRREPGQGRYLRPKGRLPLHSISDRSSNRKSGYKPFLTERPHYLPRLEKAVVSRTAKNLEWYSGHNLGGTTSKLPPLSKNSFVQQATKNEPKTPESGDRSTTPDSLSTAKTPDIMTCDSKRDLDAMSFPPEGFEQAKVIDDVAHANRPMVPKLLLPSEPYSSPRSRASPEDRTRLPTYASHQYVERQARRQPLPALETDRQNKTRKTKKIPNSQPLQTKAKAPNRLNVMIARESTQTVNHPAQQATGSCDPLKLPSITLRPASKTGELERLKSILGMANPTSPSVNSKRDLKQKDPSMRWKALYLKIMDPQKRSEMLADIVFAVRSKMRENEHQLKFGENPEDPITHNSLCDFLLYKPQKQPISKTKVRSYSFA